MPKVDQNVTRRRGVGTQALDENLALPGYTLIAPLTAKTVYLIDNHGTEVHRWELPYRVGRHARLLNNGNLVVNCKDPEAKAPFPFFNKYGGGIYLEMTPKGEIVRDFRDPLGHHDCYQYGNGRYLYTSLTALSESAAQGLLGGVAGTEAPDGKVYSDTIVEMIDGQKTWEWKAAERLDPQTFPLQKHYHREHWPLINSVYPLEDGNILASLRSVSAVIIIEKSTGNVIWHLDSTVVAQQHNATELPNGHILLFDNGAFREGISWQYSRPLEVERATKKIVWEWTATPKETVYTPFMGSAGRLPNGNTLLCESAFGRVIEITKEGEICWEYVTPYFAAYPEVEARQTFPVESNALFRAYKYAAEEIPWLHS